MTVFNPFGDTDQIPEVPDFINNSRNAGKNSAAEQGLEIPMGWKPTASEPVPVIRCSANANTTGERCKRWSLRGTTVCAKHGAQLGSVREHAEAVVDAARMRLMGMAEDAVDVLHELIQPGVPDAVRLKAVENVLNRAGIKEAIEFKVEVTNSVSAADELMKRMAIMRERAEAARRKELEAAEELAEQMLIDEGEYVEEESETL